MAKLSGTSHAPARNKNSLIRTWRLSRTGLREVWFLNWWESEAEQKRVADDYAKNAPLVEALEKKGKRKASFILEPVEMFARCRRELNSGTPWDMGRGRFLVIAVTKAEREVDGRCLRLQTEQSLCCSRPARVKRLLAKAAAAGSEARVFAVRPYWSMPASEWVAADPDFWEPNRATKVE